MNKITKKQNCLYCDNNIRKDYDINFNLSPKEINEGNRNYHIFYNKNIKKRLGKRKYKMTDERFWMILDKYEIAEVMVGDQWHTYIPESSIADVIKEITTYDKLYEFAEADANLMWKGNIPAKAKQLLLNYYNKEDKNEQKY